MFSAHAGIELYAEAFEAAGKLDRLEGFASDFGADFYRLPRNAERIRLVKREWRRPLTTPSQGRGRRRAGAHARGRPVAWELVQ